MLVPRLKLDKLGEMVLDDPRPLVYETVMKTEVLQVEEVVMQSEIIEHVPELMEIATQDPLEMPFDENLNETKAEYVIIPEENECMEPSTSSAANATEDEFDIEAFLNSLDLERLVLVQAQRDGKDVYEVHEVDQITRKIYDKPIDLPARYVDVIINVMMAEDDDDE